MSFVAPTLRRVLYGASALAFMVAGAGYAHAETIKRGNKSYQVIGAVAADLGDKKQEWVVIDSHVAPGLEGSAFWEIETFEMPTQDEMKKQMQELMSQGEVSAEQKQQMEMALQMLEQFGPLFEGMAEMGLLDNEDNETLSIHIAAFDPQAKDFLDEGGIRLNVDLPVSAFESGGEVSSDELDMYYIVKGGNTLFLPEVAYWGDDSNVPTTVTFTSFTFNDDGTAHAQGHFSGELCRWEKAKMMQGPDSSDCMMVEGGFDTKLVQPPEQPDS